jgi:hypothetical protein
MGAAAAQVTSFVCVSESICGKPTVTIHTIDRLFSSSLNVSGGLHDMEAKWIERINGYIDNKDNGKQEKKIQPERAVEVQPQQINRDSDRSGSEHRRDCKV